MRINFHFVVTFAPLLDDCKTINHDESARTLEIMRTELNATCHMPQQARIKVKGTGMSLKVFTFP